MAHDVCMGLSLLLDLHLGLLFRLLLASIIEHEGLASIYLPLSLNLTLIPDHVLLCPLFVRCPLILWEVAPDLAKMFHNLREGHI